MRALLTAVAVVVVGTLFVVGCGQPSSPTSAPLVSSSVSPTGDSVAAQSMRPTQNVASRINGGWSPGWDILNERLDYSKSSVDWHQAPGQMSNLQINYHLYGATPNWGYQVGVHLFDRCDPTFGQLQSIIPCSPAASRQGNTRAVQAFDSDQKIYTDSNGDGGVGFNIHHIASGDYKLEFDVRAGVGCGTTGLGPECNVVFQSPGPLFGDTVTISVP